MPYAKALVALFSISIIPWGEAAMRQYSANESSAVWQNDQTNQLACYLEQPIPYYGKAVFSAKASKSKPIHFQLDMLDTPGDYGQAQVVSVPPPYRPGQPSRVLASMPLYKLFDGELENAASFKMLTELEKGFNPTFYYSDWQNPDDDVAVSLSSVNFKNPYLAFLTCRDGLLPYSFEDIAFTVMNYESNSSELTRESKKRLQKIGAYLKNDPNIDAVEIAAYTDSYGGRWINLELSRKRAKAIKDYIVSQGVDESRVETTGFGEKRHIAPNNTQINRAKNRRVVIQLARTDDA